MNQEVQNFDINVPVDLEAIQKLHEDSLRAAEESSKIKEIEISSEKLAVICRRIEDLVKKVAKENVTAIVFLDKSARPFITLFLLLYKHLFPGRKKPTIRFIDIGKSGVNEKALQLPSGSNENRLIVDDVVTGGAQKAASMELLSEIDPENNWDFWQILESEEDKKVFSTVDDQIYPQMPWHRKGYGTLVEENLDRSSLFSRRQENFLKREQSLLVRKKLRLAMKEYITDKTITTE